MTSENLSPHQWVQRATKAYQDGLLEESIEGFLAARQAYLTEDNETQAAEAANSLGVALLQANRPHEALEAVRNTPEVFLAQQDEPHAAMAYGNLGAALEACGDLEGAENAYRQAVDLFAKLNDSDLHAYTLQALSRLQVKQGQPLDALTTMQTGLEAVPSRRLRDRLLRRLLNLPSRFLGR